MLPTFGPLIDHWHGFGAWTQLWMAMRALVETLSRRGRHREAAVLLGALRASPRASRVYGADSARIEAVEAAARAALGDAFEALPGRGSGARATSGPSPSPAGSPGPLPSVADPALTRARADRFPSAPYAEDWYPSECDHPVARFPYASGR